MSKITKMTIGKSRQRRVNVFLDGKTRPVGDAGISKILIELGIGGLFLFMILFSAIIFYMGKTLQTIQNFKMFSSLVALLYIPIGWMILFFKAHSVISDGMMSLGLWFFIGMFFSLAYYDQTGEFLGAFKERDT